MNMTLDQFYEEMKEALRYFGLSFGQKDEVEFFSAGTKVCLKYQNKMITIETAR